MVNKETIIKKINLLNLDKNDFYVLGSASLVLRGIIDTAHDIDLAITNKAYLKNKDNLIYLGVNHNSKWYKINEEIECCVEDLLDEKVDSSEPFNLINLEYYYNNFIKESNREKDKLKRTLLEKILFNKMN
jgi:hypothetical protein